MLDVQEVPEEVGKRCATAHSTGLPDPVFTLVALQDLTERVNRADSLESLVDSILSGLEDAFGFKQSMILVPAEEEGLLVTIATRGYPEDGAGAEVRIGEGIAGVVAEARKPIRISGLIRGMLYALAMHREAQGLPGPPRPRIPLPGLKNPQSQLGVPLLVRGELVGVLVLESEAPYRFHEEDKASIELLGSYLAIAIQNMQLQERSQDALPEAEAPAPVAVPVPPAAAAQPVAAACATRREVAYYEGDECILVDGEYLVRSLPAKILWRLLTIHDKRS